MAIELVTGHTGEAHVSSEDMGAFHAGVFGKGSYTLGEAPAIAMADANTLSIPPCDLMIQGRHVRITGTTTLTIESGAQSGTRVDLAYVRYEMASTGVETASLGIVTGSGASDPSLEHPDSILDGATISDMAIARVTLNGLTPTAEWLLESMPATGDWLRTSADGKTLKVKGGVANSSGNLLVEGVGSQLRIWTGTKIVSPSNVSYIDVLMGSEVRSMLGRDFDQNTDYFGVMNGDQKVGAFSMTGAFHPDTKRLSVNFSSTQSGPRRINWFIVAAAS